MPPAPGQEEPLTRMSKIVNSFLARPDIAPFSEPVDWRGLELYDYPEVISKMMDLGTIKRRLERGQYQTAHEVAEDVRLVWSNCMSYNADGSDFWLLAKTYARRFEDRYRKVRNEFDVGDDFYLEDDDEPPSTKSSTKVSASSGGRSSKSSSKETAAPSFSSPSLDARAKFGANLFLLGGAELGWVFTDLEVNCPHVLESWGESKVEINVDEIPTEIFERLNQYVSGLVKDSCNDVEPEVPRKKKRKT